MDDRLNVLHIVLNSFPPDYRVLKHATALANWGASVKILALWEYGFMECEDIDGIHVQRFRIWSKLLPKRQMFLPLKFVECVVRMVWCGLRERPWVVHAHDLSGLVVGYLIACLSGCILIYDSHELWSDLSGIEEFPRWCVYLALAAERLMVHRANRVITVSQGIAHQMELRLGIVAPVVIRNVPERIRSAGVNGLRQSLKIPPEAVIFLYVGAIVVDRGVETILEAFGKLGHSNAYLVFLGARRLPEWMQVTIPDDVRDRVCFHPPVHPREVVAYAHEADIGVHAIRGSSENHRLCLPNKLFEYIQAGLAVLVTDLPEMAAIVKAYGVGRVFLDDDVNGLASEMRAMMEDPGSVKAMREASIRASESLCWDKEQKVLLHLYTDLAHSKIHV